VIAGPSALPKLHLFHCERYSHAAESKATNAAIFRITTAFTAKLFRKEPSSALPISTLTGILSKQGAVGILRIQGRQPAFKIPRIVKFRIILDLWGAAFQDIENGPFGCADFQIHRRLSRFIEAVNLAQSFDSGPLWGWVLGASPETSENRA
jgi:hypothetical protein